VNWGFSKAFGFAKSLALVWLGAVLAAGGPNGAAASSRPNLRAELEEVRRVSGQDWQRAQVLLDELAPAMDQAEQRDSVEFQLLQARHLALADRAEQGLILATELLDLDLPDDQRLRVLQFSANLSVLLRRYESAFESLVQALSIDVSPDDRAPRIATLNMAAYMLGRVDEYERGIDYGEQALRLARRMNDRSAACISLQRLAPVYKWAELPEQAERAYRAGIEDCSEIGNDLFVGVLQHGLADLLRRLDRLDEALALAQAAIEALQSSVYPLGEFEARLVRAETLHALGATPSSQPDELVQLGSYFADRGLWDQQARLEQLKAEQAEQNGDFERALLHTRRYTEARELFLDRERSMRLAYLQVEFDSRFQQQEIELLRESTRVAQLESQSAAQQRQIRGFVLLLLGAIFLVLVALLVRVVQSRRRFRDLSRHDGLSGLANHTWFFEQAQSLLDRFVAQSEPNLLVLVAADIDHFKHVNDTHGHRVGDGVLGRTARQLREVFPDGALVGRVGGEEFAVLIQVQRLEEVMACLERFRAPKRTAVRSGDPAVTVSFGLSCYRPGDDIHTLRERADRALYRAKQSGRDRIVRDESCPGSD
jgi:diguanylate cyclase (GGDEF)-like protein